MSFNKIFKTRILFKSYWTPVLQIFILHILFISILIRLLKIGIINPFKMFKNLLTTNFFLKWVFIVVIDFLESNLLKEWWPNKKIFHYSLRLTLKKVWLKVKMIQMSLLMAQKDIQILLPNFHNPSINLEKESIAIMDLCKHHLFGTIWFQLVRIFHLYQVLKEMNCLII